MATFNENSIKRINGKKLEKLLFKDTIEVNDEVAQVFNDSNEVLKKQNIKKVTDFALWNHSWNEYGIYGDKRTQLRDTRFGSTYTKGKILNIDFGHHNFGEEFSYVHMGIVLRDFKELLVVVPVTSDKGQTFNNETKDVVIKVDKNVYTQFHNDSILLVNQIKCISRNRIRAIFQSINNTTLFTELERKLFMYYCPGLNKTMQNELSDLYFEKYEQETKIKEQEEKILQLTAELERLKHPV